MIFLWDVIIHSITILIKFANFSQSDCLNWVLWQVEDPYVDNVAFIQSVKILVDVWFYHDDVIKWKHFPRYWPFVREIHRSPVNFPHKGQWRGALMFALICVWINGWVNNREAGDLRHYSAHYDVIVMCLKSKRQIVILGHSSYFLSYSKRESSKKNSPCC